MLGWLKLFRVRKRGPWAVIIVLCIVSDLIIFRIQPVAMGTSPDSRLCSFPNSLVVSLRLTFTDAVNLMWPGVVIWSGISVDIGSDKVDYLN